MKFSDNVSLQNKKLISASGSGDVMTVVSLLNSGADVQTEDEVYILFSLFVHHGAFFTLAFSCLSMLLWSAIVIINNVGLPTTHSIRCQVLLWTIPVNMVISKWFVS